MHRGGLDKSGSRGGSLSLQPVVGLRSTTRSSRPSRPLQRPGRPWFSCRSSCPSAPGTSLFAALARMSSIVRFPEGPLLIRAPSGPPWVGLLILHRILRLEPKHILLCPGPGARGPGARAPGARAPGALGGSVLRVSYHHCWKNFARDQDGRRARDWCRWEPRRRGPGHREPGAGSPPRRECCEEGWGGGGRRGTRGTVSSKRGPNATGCLGKTGRRGGRYPSPNGRGVSLEEDRKISLDRLLPRGLAEIL